MQKLKEKIEHELIRYEYVRGINTKIDEIIDYLDREFPDYSIEEVIIGNTENIVETVQAKREIKQFKCAINLDPDVDCCECDEFCCPHYTEETIGFEDYTYDITRQKIASDSYMKIIITCHKDDEKSMATTTTNTNRVFVNTYAVESTATRHHPNSWEWRCVNQLTLERK
jgi:hypothetical protein